MNRSFPAVVAATALVFAAMATRAAAVHTPPSLQG
jgi:hypothetical protein